MIRITMALLVASLLGIAAWALAAEDEAVAVRAVLDRYLESATYPGEPDFDPGIFTKDTEAWWSGGRVYEGRKAAITALVAAWRQLPRDFERFAPRVRDQRLVVRGEMAWLSARIDLTGTLTKDRGELLRPIRSTFVFEKTGGRWRIAHEHSSRIAGVEK